MKIGELGLVRPQHLLDVHMYICSFEEERGSDGFKLWTCLWTGLCVVDSWAPHSAPNTRVLLLPIPCIVYDYYDDIG